MARRKKSKRLPKAVALLATVALVCVALGVGVLSWSLSSGDSPKTAAIVDQLSLTEPNPDFVEAATSLLEEAGYAVDYYPGEEVTVEFYRDLPTERYQLVILRVHSGLTSLTRTYEEVTDQVALFTSSPYSEAKYLEQSVDSLAIASYRVGGPRYFAIMPDFVKSSMRGRFDDTTIILMGCDGLASDKAAEAFVQRGASAFLSWSGLVSARYTDAATERLLDHLVIDGLTVQQAIAQTMTDVGPDPEYGSILLVYPSEEAAPAVP